MTDYPPTLAAALALLQTKLPEVRRSERALVETKTGATFTYTYAGLANISSQILPLLGELGLSFSARPTLTPDGKFVLAYELLHVSGENRTGEYPLSGSTPQAIGSAITYGRRYTLCAITGLAPDEDDDAASAQAEAAASKGTAQRANTPRRTRPAAAGPAGTAQRARPDTGGQPPLPGEPERATDPQVQRIVIGFDTLGVADRGDRLRLTSQLVRRHLNSARELTKPEAHRLIDLMETATKQDDPFAWLNEHITQQADEGATP